MKTFEHITYDDVNIVPKYSEIEHRFNCNTKTAITKSRHLYFPIVSSPMDTVTELDMAIALWSFGGLGFIHRFMSIKDQVNNVGSVFDYIRNLNVALKAELQTGEINEDLVINGQFIDKEWIDNPPIGAAIGVTGDYLERAHELVNNGANIILLDVAHGHHILVKNALTALHNQRFSHKVEFIAGNIATRIAAIDLLDWGVDGLRVGLGNGSLCETRIRTGIGIPQISALLETSVFNIPIIGDGGCRMIGDICKGIAAGADTIMLGSLLAGTKETPGRIIRNGKWPNEKLFKKYQGSSSEESKIQRNESEKNVEGNSKLIPYKGKIQRILRDIQNGLKSSMSYVGVSTISDYQLKSDFIRVTQSSHIEGLPHLMIE